MHAGRPLERPLVESSLMINGTVIAYLAPELPARSATFVYEELLAVERAGVSVVPFSVRSAEDPASDQVQLARRVRVLYGRWPLLSALLALGRLPYFWRRLPEAFRALWADLGEVDGSSSKLRICVQFAVAFRLAAWLRDEACVHLHVHFAHVPCQIGMYASLLAGIPFTVTGHANDLFERGQLLAQKARRAKSFLTISQFNRDFLIGAGLPPEKVAVVRCGVALRTHARRVRGSAGGDVFVIGSLARLVEKKGMDVLLRAVACLVGDGRGEVQLQVAGLGPERSRLEELVDELGLSAHVLFVGALSHQEVGGWLDTLDCFVLACRQDRNGDMDGIPVVLMEAMAVGVPVVSTRLSGIPELVVHEHTGLLAEPGDVDSLVGEVARLQSDPGLGARLAAAAARHVQVEFSQEVNVERLLRSFGLQSDGHGRIEVQCDGLGMRDES